MRGLLGRCCECLLTSLSEHQYMYICQVTALRCRSVAAAPSRQRNPRGEGGAPARAAARGDGRGARRGRRRGQGLRARDRPPRRRLPDRALPPVPGPRRAGRRGRRRRASRPSTPSSTPRRRPRRSARAPGGDGHRLPGVLRAPAGALRDPVLRPPDRCSSRPAVPRERGFDGLVALLRQVDTTLDADDARQLALLIWSSLHGYAMLRVARPHFDWPDAETYIRRLLVGAPPLSAQRLSFFLRLLELALRQSRFFGLRCAL